MSQFLPVDGYRGGEGSKTVTVRTARIIPITRVRSETARAMKREDQERIEFIQRIFGRHEKLVSYIQRIVKRREIAEELTQDAYLRFFKRYKPDKALNTSAMIYAIALRRALTYYKRFKHELGGAVPLEDSDHAPGPETVFASEEMIAHICQALEKLSPKLRNAFVLKDVERKTDAEVAEILGVEVDAARQRVLRARKECRRLLAIRGVTGFKPD